MEIILIVLTSVLLTALCIGCFILGYRFADSKKDKAVIDEGNADYYKSISNLFTFGTKEGDKELNE